MQAKAAVPLGGYKGFGLGLLVEILSGILTGSGSTHSIGRMYTEWDRRQNVGHFMLVLDPGRAVGRQAFVERMGQLWEMMKSTPAAPGFDEVLLPGEPEERIRAHRLLEGIPLPESLYRELVEVSSRLGVKVP
jgi:ureidoglycolate dehydrogenase (NAD+)